MDGSALRGCSSLSSSSDEPSSDKPYFLFLENCAVIICELALRTGDCLSSNRHSNLQRSGHMPATWHGCHRDMARLLSPTSGRREVMGKGCGRMNGGKYCVYMCVNAKMIPGETVPGLWGGR
jgi:hypothetical protein